MSPWSTDATHAVEVEHHGVVVRVAIAKRDVPCPDGRPTAKRRGRPEPICWGARECLLVDRDSGLWHHPFALDRSLHCAGHHHRARQAVTCGDLSRVTTTKRAFVGICAEPLANLAVPEKSADSSRPGALPAWVAFAGMKGARAEGTFVADATFDSRSSPMMQTFRSAPRTRPSNARLVRRAGGRSIGALLATLGLTACGHQSNLPR
jgi:hypothetical protein